jgi:CPA1 family monovalent cation:H+ antiporter
MRGLVTLATALALPPSFPSRDLIVLSAFAVILGTLLIQGTTLGPLIRRLHFPADASLASELATARVDLLNAAMASVEGRQGEAARQLRGEYLDAKTMAARGDNPRSADIDELRRTGLAARRARLAELRERGEIEDDVFHELEEELDWAELAHSTSERRTIVEG